MTDKELKRKNEIMSYGDKMEEKTAEEMFKCKVERSYRTDDGLETNDGLKFNVMNCGHHEVDGWRLEDHIKECKGETNDR